MNFASPNIRFAAIVAIGLSLAATAAQAQYVGPGSPGVATDVAFWPSRKTTSPWC